MHATSVDEVDSLRVTHLSVGGRVGEGRGGGVGELTIQNAGTHCLCGWKSARC